MHDFRIEILRYFRSGDWVIWIYSLEMKGLARERSLPALLLSWHEEILAAASEMASTVGCSILGGGRSSEEEEGGSPLAGLRLASALRKVEAWSRERVHIPNTTGRPG
jgi:hypothetical protein